jgi:hypothetical protein
MAATIASSLLVGVSEQMTEHAVTNPVIAVTHTGRLANNSLIADIFCSGFNVRCFLRSATAAQLVALSLQGQSKAHSVTP